MVRCGMEDREETMREGKERRGQEKRESVVTCEREGTKKVKVRKD